MILLSFRLSDTLVSAFVITSIALMFAFWLWMLIDAIRFSKNKGNMQWLFIVAFFGILGAAVYYFTGRKKRIKAENPYSGIVD
jgi:ABC-type multidrug transport system fused ATPase/permease subunit